MKKIELNGNKNIIHRRLREFREKRGYTQEELATKMQLFSVNMDQQMISKIERNTRIVTEYKLVTLCRVLKVTVAELTQDYDELAKDS